MRRLRENTDARNRNQQDRRGRGRGPRHRPARRLHVYARRLGRGLGGQGACRRRAEGAGRRDRRARHAAGAGGRRAIRARRPTAPCAGSASRSASSSPARRCSSRACASSPTSISPARRATPCRRGSISGSSRTSSGCSSRCSRSPPPRTSPASRAASPSSSTEALGVLERQKVAEEVKGLDQAVARHVAQIRRALRRLSHLCAGAAQARAARAGDAALGAQARRLRRPRGSSESQQLAASGRTSIAADKDIAEGALPHRRLSRLRRARGARRHSGAARRPDPSGAGLARGRAGREAAGRDSTASASPSPSA